jgi:hypothetical protein
MKLKKKKKKKENKKRKKKEVFSCFMHVSFSSKHAEMHI